MKNTNKNMLDYCNNTVFCVLTFDRSTGKRISTLGNCSPLYALHEISKCSKILNRVSLLLPGDITHPLNITLEQAIQLAIFSEKFDC